MKQKLFTLFATLMCSISMFADDSPVVYSAFNESTGTLTYYYDANRASRGGRTELYNPEATRFKDYNTSVVKAVIDVSMKDAPLTSLENLFYGNIDMKTNKNMFLSAMTSIEGLENLNTSIVTSMNAMFYGCKALTTLDLTSFNVEKVEDMQYMFMDCQALTTILCNEDWSVGDVKSTLIFSGCKVLAGGKGTGYDGSKADKAYARPDGGTERPGYFTATPHVYTEFNEETGTLTYYYDDLRATRTGVTEAYDPVSKPYAVRFTSYYDKVQKAVIAPTMKNASLTSMKGMFYGGINSETGTRQYLSVLTNIEGLENLNTSEVTNMHEMFSGCNALESLDLRAFSIAKVTDMGSMFEKCKALTTIYCNDDWSGSTAESSKLFYNCSKLKGGQGTAYKYSTNDIVYARPDGGTESPGLFTAVVTEVYTEFDEETGTLMYYYDDLRATRSGLTEGYDPVGNPKAVRFTGYYDYVKKAVIDPSMKDAGLTSMTRMFYGGFNIGTDARQSLSAMTEVEGMEYLNTAEVTNTSEMFDGCESLTSIDLRTFSIAKVDNLASMFSNCKELTTIYCNDDWSYSTAPSMNLFYNCKKLKGGKGTEYIYKDIDIGSDIVYARPDGLGGEPGYFTVIGDVDGNGKVTIADVEAIANYIIGNPPADFNETLADVNHDGVINVADLVLLIAH